MKAQRITGHGPVENNPLVLTDVDRPKAGDRELLVHVKACAICHTDLHVIEGELPTKNLPLIPGHQIVGIVEDLGAGVAGYKIGDRVGVGWLNSTCGECEFCGVGEENLCPHARFTGYDVNGGYAEYVVVPSDYAYPIPKRFSDEEAAPLMCAGIIGFRALRSSGLKPGGRLGLFGFGASAHIVIQLARRWGAEVYVFSRSEDHRKHAAELGAVWTGTADMRPSPPLDSVISFAPVGGLVPQALNVLRRGGTLALAGIFMSPIPQIDYSLLYHEKIVRSVANFTRQDAIDFLKLADEIPVRTEVEVYPLAEANRALRLLKERKGRGAAVLSISG